MGPTDSSAKMNNDRGVFIAISCEGLHQRARIYQLGLWLAIFFAIFLRLPPNKFLRFRRTFHQFRLGWLCYFCYCNASILTARRHQEAKGITRHPPEILSECGGNYTICWPRS